MKVLTLVLIFGVLTCLLGINFLSDRVTDIRKTQVQIFERLNQLQDLTIENLEAEIKFKRNLIKS